MKRQGYLYQKVCDLDNIMLAFECATKGKKSKYREVRRLLGNQLENCKKLQRLLVEKKYYINKNCYHTVIKNAGGVGGKERVINKLAMFPHRIVQWAAMLVIEPIFLKHFCFHTCSCVPNGGINRAWHLMVKALENEEETTWCLKIDVKKFYDNIDHGILKQALRRIIKDPDMLWLLNMIIDSFGDYGKGLPLGSYFSQYGANYFLSPLDHHLKERKGIKHIVRFMDDIVILHHDKNFLHELLKEINVILQSLKLQLKGNYQIFNVEERGVDFVGYVFRHNRNIKLRRKSKMRLRSISNAVKKKGYITDKQWSALNSFVGFFHFYNSKAIYDTYIADIQPLLCDYYDKNIGAGDVKKLKKFKRRLFSCRADL